ncbi:MAG: apolipoprotein N-acyltransferase [Bacteroidota bacterium]
MKKTISISASLFSGLLLFAAWPVSPLTFLIFFGFTPLLFVADGLQKKSTFFWHSFLTLLIWNASTTWWIWNSTDIGSIAAIIANSLFMCLPWWGFFAVKKRSGNLLGYSALISFWMLFEYIHLNWQLSWPWLTIGNVFASHPEWIQWYEFTGVSGGTLWVLLSNILVFEIIQSIRLKDPLSRIIIKFSYLLILPLLFSFFNLFYYLKHSDRKTAQHNVVIVQPNIDPFQKFDAANTSQQIATLIQLSEKQIDSATRLIIWPETAMSAVEWQPNVRNNNFYQPIFEFVNRHPEISLVSGIETLKSYSSADASATASKREDGTYVDAFNAAILIKANQPLDFYNKSKLVPGVESLPTFLKFMGPIFEKFGGSSGGYGKSNTSSVFHSDNNPYFVAPIICYESIYGEYVSTYVAKGANILTILTNDGWWGNTPGHKQHLEYARLRAIENRKWVARSANTGISAVIDDKGNILETRGWNKAASIKFSIPTTDTLTFYTRFGDWLYKGFSFLALLILGWNIFLVLKKKQLV